MDVFHLLIYSRKEEISILPLFFHIWIVVLGKTLESPLDSKEIKPDNPKGNQPWIFIGRTDAIAEAPILWPPDAKSWLIRKKPWCWERLKAGGEGENRGWDGWMASLTHGREFKQTLENSGGQGSLACCSPWVCKKSDMTSWLNNNNKGYDPSKYFINIV